MIVLVVVGQRLAVDISNLSCFVFSPNISPHTKFHPNWIKTRKVKENHYWSALFGRSSWSDKVVAI